MLSVPSVISGGEYSLHSMATGIPWKPFCAGRGGFYLCNLTSALCNWRYWLQLPGA
jgi:hypothetical protein